MKELTRLLSLAPMLVLGAGLAHANLITNGGFENGGGSLTGWTETDQAAGSGNLGATESSTVSRNQLVGGNPRFATLAVYTAPVPEPASLGLISLGAISLLGRRRNKTA